MTQYIILCRSLTHAQQSEKLLERAGITASLIKAPKDLRSSGCGYALTVIHHADEAIALLKNRNMLSGKIYQRSGNGEYTECRP